MSNGSGDFYININAVTGGDKELNKIINNAWSQGKSLNEINEILAKSTGTISEEWIAPDYQHISLESLKSNVGEGWLFKEENAVELLNKHYITDQGLKQIRFEQSARGKNQIKIIRGRDKVIGTINLSQGKDWNEINQEIKLAIDGEFKSGDTDKILTKVADIFSGNTHLFELDGKIGGALELGGFFPDNPRYMAEFAYVGDVSSGQVEGGVATFELPDVRSGQKAIPNTGGRISESAVSRDFGTIAEVFTFGRYEGENVDMSGGILLYKDNKGDYYSQSEVNDLTQNEIKEKGIVEDQLIPYEFLWHNRPKLQELSLQLAITAGTENLIKEHGSKEKSISWLVDNQNVPLSIDDRLIANLADDLEGTTDEDEKNRIKKDIKSKLKEMYPGLPEEDLETMMLFDKNDNFIRIKKPIVDEGFDGGIEMDASKIAYENDREYVEDKLLEKYLTLLHYAKMSHANWEKIDEQSSFFQLAGEKIGDNIKEALEGDLAGLMLTNMPTESPMFKDKSALDAVVENNSLYIDGRFTLTELPDGTSLGDRFDEAYRDFLTWNRALALNIDISRTPEENTWIQTIDAIGEAFTSKSVITDITLDEARDVFEATLKHDGFEVPEHVINGTFGLNPLKWSLGKGTSARHIVEGATEGLAHLGPLLFEIGLYKKAYKSAGVTIGGKNMESIHATVASLANRYTSHWKNPIARKLIDNIMVPAVATPIEWASAEAVGQELFGGHNHQAFHSHTINTTTGETNLTFPVVMGMTGGTFSLISQGVAKGIKSTAFGKNLMARIQNPESFFKTKRTGRIISEAGAHIGKNVGAGATGMALMVTAEIAQETVNTYIEEGRWDLAEKFKEIATTEHLMTTWLMLLMLSAKDVSPKIREAYRRDVEALRESTKKTQDAFEAFGLKEGELKDYKEIDEVFEKLKESEKESYDADFTGPFTTGYYTKGLKERIKILENHKKELYSYLTIKDMKRAAKESGDYFKNYTLENWKVIESFRKNDPSTWKGEDYERLAGLKHNELYSILRERGIEPGSFQFKMYEDIHQSVKIWEQWAEGHKLHKGTPERERFFQNMIKLQINSGVMTSLKEQIKKGEKGESVGSVEKAKIELDKLKETNEKLYEEMKSSIDGWDAKWNEMLKAEVNAAAALSKKLGTELMEVKTEDEWRKLGFVKGKDAAYSGGKIYLNIDVIKRTGNLGAPFHEVIHHILRGSLKDSKGIVTKEGIKIIDNLVSRFTPKEQKIIQKRIDEQYKYEKTEDGKSFKLKDGKTVLVKKANIEAIRDQLIEKSPGKYYEEYITVISDAIKNKEIKYEYSKMRHVGGLINSWISPVFKDMYKYDELAKGNGMDSHKAAKDLYNLLGDVSVVKKVKQRVIEGLKELPSKVVEKTDYSASKDLFAEKTVVKDLGLKEGTKKIIEKNKKLFEDVVKQKEKLEKKRGETVSLKESVTQQIKDELVLNNMPRVSALAKYADAVGRAQPLEGRLRKGFEDFYSEYALKLVELTNTWNPAVNPNFGAYMNQLLPKKYSGILEKLKKGEIEKTISIDKGEALKVEAEVTKGKEFDGKTIKLSDRFGKEGETIHKKIMDMVERGDVKLFGLPDKSFKTLKDLVSNEVQEMFGVKPKVGNLTKIDTRNAQMFINKNVETLISMLPEGTNPSGTSTGVQKVLLDNFYTKKERVKAIETGSKAGLPVQVKNSKITPKQFLEVFGITERGKPNLYKKDTNTSSRVKALIAQTERMMVNQAIREKLIKDGNGLDALASHLAEGKSEVMYSSSADKSPFKPVFYENRRQFLLEVHRQGGSKEGIRAALDNVYKETLPKTLKTAITKDYVKILAPYFDRQSRYKGFGKKFPKSIEKFVRDVEFSADQVSVGNYFDVLSKGGSVVDFHRNPIERKEYQNFTKDLALLSLEKTIERKLPNILAEGKFESIEAATQSIKDQFIADRIRTKSHLENGDFNPKRAMAFNLKDGFIKDYLSKHPGYEGLIGYERKSKKDKKTGKTEYWVELKFEGNKTRKVILPESSIYDGKQKTTQEHIEGKISELEKKLRKENADFHWKNLIEELRSAKETVENSEISVGPHRGYRYGNVQLAMLCTGYLGNMKTSLRAAALLRYLPVDAPTNKLYERVWDSKKEKYVNKKLWEYEHGWPAKQMILLLADNIFRGNKKIDLNKLKESYSVGIIHRDFNKNIGEVFKDRAHYDYKVGDIPPERWFNLMTSYGPSHKVRDVYTNKIYGEKQVRNWERVKVESAKVLKDNNALMKKVIGDQYSSSSRKEIIKDIRTINKALNLGRLTEKKKRGMSTFDFDETLIDKGKNFVIAKNPITGEKIKVSSEKWPIEGPKLAKEGYIFDFKDFVNVRGGVEGPLFKKLQNQIKKYGIENIYVLTARPAESAKAIHAWLKSKGVNIPLKNITGLGNSTGEAKAMWMLEKFSEGYNDMYFVDDALPNVKAVKKVLDKLDIKSNVQQVRYSSSNNKKISEDFNKIIEETFGIGAEKRFSEAKARIITRGKGKHRFTGSPGAEDLMGLVTYAFAGKGKQGEGHVEFFKKHIHRPYNRAYSDIVARKQNISNDYALLRKQMPEVRRKLNDTVDGVYTVEQAVRVFLWDKSGFDIPGLSKRDKKTLVDFVKQDFDLITFAERLSEISMLPDGYIKPKDYWMGENITLDMNNVVDRVYRKQALAEFIENREGIFGKWDGGRLVGPNMNKIEYIYGSKHREALENMLWRMENMTNRTVGKDSNVNRWMNWVNNATGTIMFFNQKSAALQLISTLNYVNGTFNNPFRAAQTFINQKQYWKDFAKIWNSDFLLQRRAGLKINIEAAEIMERVAGSKNKASAALAYLLEKGFIPTKYADSFAISMGGASYYRNLVRIKIKEGWDVKSAEKKAFEEFMEFTEYTQQSSRPDLISQQQASSLGRPILAFANTPMQMFRRHKRRIQDIANRRGNDAENVASGLYYGAAQTMIFSFLANAMFAVDDESGDEEDIKHAKRQKDRYVNTIVDSYLRGMGTQGAAVAAFKNGLLSFIKESKKDWNADYANVVIDMLNVSPPIGSKARKIYSAGQTYKYNKEVIPEMGLDFDNPAIMGIANILSATLNIPADRAVMKLQNIRDASMGDFENWQRISMLMGINKWNLGVGEEAPGVKRVEAIKDKLKLEKKQKKELEKEKKVDIKTKEVEVLSKDDIIKNKSKQVFDFNKREQNKILEGLNLNPKDYPKEQDRVDIIMEHYNKDSKKMDSTFNAIEKYVPTKNEKRSIELFNLTKKQQIDLLMDLGIIGEKLNKLKYEEDRVKKIIELEAKKKVK